MMTSSERSQNSVLTTNRKRTVAFRLAIAFVILCISLQIFFSSLPPSSGSTTIKGGGRDAHQTQTQTQTHSTKNSGRTDKGSSLPPNTRNDHPENTDIRRDVHIDGDGGGGVHGETEASELSSATKNLLNMSTKRRNIRMMRDFDTYIPHEPFDFRAPSVPLFGLESYLMTSIASSSSVLSGEQHLVNGDGTAKSFAGDPPTPAPSFSFLGRLGERLTAALQWLHNAFWQIFFPRAGSPFGIQDPTFFGFHPAVRERFWDRVRILNNLTAEVLRLQEQQEVVERQRLQQKSLLKPSSSSSLLGKKHTSHYLVDDRDTDTAAAAYEDDGVHRWTKEMHRLTTAYLTASANYSDIYSYYYSVESAVSSPPLVGSSSYSLPTEAKPFELEVMAGRYSSYYGSHRCYLPPITAGMPTEDEAAERNKHLPPLTEKEFMHSDEVGSHKNKNNTNDKKQFSPRLLLGRHSANAHKKRAMWLVHDATRRARIASSLGAAYKQIIIVMDLLNVLQHGPAVAPAARKASFTPLNDEDTPMEGSAGANKKEKDSQKGVSKEEKKREEETAIDTHYWRLVEESVVAQYKVLMRDLPLSALFYTPSSSSRGDESVHTNSNNVNDNKSTHPLVKVVVAVAPTPKKERKGTPSPSSLELLLKKRLMRRVTARLGRGGGEGGHHYVPYLQLIMVDSSEGSTHISEEKEGGTTVDGKKEGRGSDEWDLDIGDTVSDETVLRLDVPAFSFVRVENLVYACNHAHLSPFSGGGGRGSENAIALVPVETWAPADEEKKKEKGLGVSNADTVEKTNKKKTTNKRHTASSSSASSSSFSSSYYSHPLLPWDHVFVANAKVSSEVISGPFRFRQTAPAGNSSVVYIQEEDQRSIKKEGLGSVGGHGEIRNRRASRRFVRATFIQAAKPSNDREHLKSAPPPSRPHSLNPSGLARQNSLDATFGPSFQITDDIAPWIWGSTHEENNKENNNNNRVPIVLRRGFLHQGSLVLSLPQLQREHVLQLGRDEGKTLTSVAKRLQKKNDNNTNKASGEKCDLSSCSSSVAMLSRNLARRVRYATGQEVAAARYPVDDMNIIIDSEKGLRAAMVDTLAAVWNLRTNSFVRDTRRGFRTRLLEDGKTAIKNSNHVKGRIAHRTHPSMSGEFQFLRYPAFAEDSRFDFGNNKTRVQNFRLVKKRLWARAGGFVGGAQKEKTLFKKDNQEAIHFTLSSSNTTLPSSYDHPHDPKQSDVDLDRTYFLLTDTPEWEFTHEHRPSSSSSSSSSSATRPSSYSKTDPYLFIPNASLHRMHYGLLKHLLPSPPMTTTLGLLSTRSSLYPSTLGANNNNNDNKAAPPASAISFSGTRDAAARIVDAFMAACKRQKLPSDSLANDDTHHEFVVGSDDAALRVMINENANTGETTAQSPKHNAMKIRRTRMRRQADILKLLNLYMSRLHNVVLAPRSRLRHLLDAVALKVGIARHRSPDNAVKGLKEEETEDNSCSPLFADLAQPVPINESEKVEQEVYTIGAARHQNLEKISGGEQKREKAPTLSLQSLTIRDVLICSVLRAFSTAHGGESSSRSLSGSAAASDKKSKTSKKSKRDHDLIQSVNEPFAEYLRGYYATSNGDYSAHPPSLLKSTLQTIRGQGGDDGNIHIKTICTNNGQSSAGLVVNRSAADLRGSVSISTSSSDNSIFDSSPYAAALLFDGANYLEDAEIEWSAGGLASHEQQQRPREYLNDGSNVDEAYGPSISSSSSLLTQERSLSSSSRPKKTRKKVSSASTGTPFSTPIMTNFAVCERQGITRMASHIGVFIASPPGSKLYQKPTSLARYQAKLRSFLGHESTTKTRISSPPLPPKKEEEEEAEKKLRRHFVPVDPIKDAHVRKRALRAVEYVTRRIQSHSAMPIRDAVDIYLHTNSEAGYLRDLLKEVVGAEAGVFVRVRNNGPSAAKSTTGTLASVSKTESNKAAEKEGFATVSSGAFPSTPPTPPRVLFQPEDDLQHLYNYRGDTLDRFDHDEYALLPVVRLHHRHSRQQQPTVGNAKEEKESTIEKVTTLADSNNDTTLLRHLKSSDQGRHFTETDTADEEVKMEPFLPPRIRIFVVEHQITEARGDYMQWKARILMKELQGLYDLQVYCEEDIRLNPRSIALYCQWNGALRERGLLLTFTRPEHHPYTKKKVMMNRMQPTPQHFVTATIPFSSDLSSTTTMPLPFELKSSSNSEEGAVHFPTYSSTFTTPLGKGGNTPPLQQAEGSGGGVFGGDLQIVALRREEQSTSSSMCNNRKRRFHATIDTFSLIPASAQVNKKSERFISTISNSLSSPALELEKTFAFTAFDGSYAGLWVVDNFDMDRLTHKIGYFMEDADFRQRFILEHASCDNGNRMLDEVYRNGWVFPLRGVTPKIAKGVLPTGLEYTKSGLQKALLDPHGLAKYGSKMPLIVKTRVECVFEEDKKEENDNKVSDSPSYSFSSPADVASIVSMCLRKKTDVREGDPPRSSKSHHYHKASLYVVSTNTTAAGVIVGRLGLHLSQPSSSSDFMRIRGLLPKGDGGDLVPAYDNLIDHLILENNRKKVRRTYRDSGGFGEERMDTVMEEGEGGGAGQGNILAGLSNADSVNSRSSTHEMLQKIVQGAYEEIDKGRRNAFYAESLQFAVKRRGLRQREKRRSHLLRSELDALIVAGIHPKELVGNTPCLCDEKDEDANDSFGGGLCEEPNKDDDGDGKRSSKSKRAAHRLSSQINNNNNNTSKGSAADYCQPSGTFTFVMGSGGSIQEVSRGASSSCLHCHHRHEKHLLLDSSLLWTSSVTATTIRRFFYRRALAAGRLLTSTEGEASAGRQWYAADVEEEMKDDFPRLADSETFFSAMRRWYSADNSANNVYSSPLKDIQSVVGSLSSNVSPPKKTRFFFDRVNDIADPSALHAVIYQSIEGSSSSSSSSLVRRVGGGKFLTAAPPRSIPEHHYSYYNGDLLSGWSDPRFMVHHMDNKYIHVDHGHRPDNEVNTFDSAERYRQGANALDLGMN